MLSDRDASPCMIIKPFTDVSWTSLLVRTSPFYSRFLQARVFLFRFRVYVREKSEGLQLTSAIFKDSVEALGALTNYLLTAIWCRCGLFALFRAGAR
jgi:hypothetical protein